MTPEIKYVTRCSYCHSEIGYFVVVTQAGSGRKCIACNAAWTPEMVKITTEKVEVERG